MNKLILWDQLRLYIKFLKKIKIIEMLLLVQLLQDDHIQ